MSWILTPLRRRQAIIHTCSSIGATNPLRCFTSVTKKWTRSVRVLIHFQYAFRSSHDQWITIGQFWDAGTAIVEKITDHNRIAQLRNQIFEQVQIIIPSPSLVTRCCTLSWMEWPIKQFNSFNFVIVLLWQHVWSTRVVTFHSLISLNKVKLNVC